MAESGLKQRLGSAQDQFAEGFAALVRSTSPERLERVMRTPVRQVLLAGIFRQMPDRFDSKRAGSMNSIARWVITGRRNGGSDVYDVVIADGKCKVVRGGGNAEPRVTITVDGVEFLKIATGASNPTQAYFAGRVALNGDIMVAAKLGMLFRKPGEA